MVVGETEDRYASHFQLRPFAPVRDSPRVHLGGLLHRFPGVLSIEYRLEGDLRSVAWPTPCPAISRRHDLWQQTCFELFFGILGEPGYWEVNLSPGGCWNLYRFNGYRQGMQEEAALDRLICYPVREDNSFSLSCRIEMDRLVPDYQKLQIGIAAVIFDITGIPAHWAIDHLENVADFHSRRNFQRMLPGVATR